METTDNLGLNVADRTDNVLVGSNVSENFKKVDAAVGEDRGKAGDLEKTVTALSTGDINPHRVLSASTESFQKGEIVKDASKKLWSAKSTFTKSGGYPSGYPDGNFTIHSVKENADKIENLFEKYLILGSVPATGGTSGVMDLDSYKNLIIILGDNDSTWVADSYFVPTKFAKQRKFYLTDDVALNDSVTLGVGCVVYMNSNNSITVVKSAGNDNDNKVYVIGVN